MQVIVKALAGVSVRLLFDVLPWAVFRFLPSAVPPALIPEEMVVSAQLCHSPCTEIQTRGGWYNLSGRVILEN